MSALGLAITIAMGLFAYFAGEFVGWYRAHRLIWGHVQRFLEVKVDQDLAAIRAALLAQARAEVKGDDTAKEGDRTGS